MSTKKISTILSLIDVAETNIRNAKSLLKQLTLEKGIKIESSSPSTYGPKSNEESDALEVVEGYFDGENMVGDNGQMYPVPQNYASKTQLVIGDRMKWILTSEREIFKLIQPTSRRRVTGTFAIEGENYIILVDELSSPVKILKASATYAIKNLSLKVGDEVAIYIPQDATPIWGAFISVVKGSNEISEEIKAEKATSRTLTAEPSELDSLHEFKLGDDKISSDFF